MLAELRGWHIAAFAGKASLILNRKPWPANFSGNA
jgi:hypothetical protein